jgi:hypothetical protein
MAGLLWGLRNRSRSWVVLSSGFLAATAIAQLAGYIVDLSTWVLLGGAGVILLTVGLVALQKRQRILELRRAVTQEWGAWSA